MKMTGSNSVIYNLSDEPLARGGEGAIYKIIGKPDLVAKIYHKQVDSERIEKLKAMTALKIDPYINGVARLSWPTDILYENGAVRGCVMPKINDSLKLLNVQRQKDPVKDKAYPKYQWKYSVQIAYNFALMVAHMHSRGIIIGDFNPNNFVIDKDHGGAVVLLDCDSFDFRHGSKHYRCEVAFDEVLAPELQNAGLLSQATFTKEADCFSLAVHIFRLLMNNQDPFGSVNVGKNKSSSVGNCNNLPIIKGECLYIKSVPGKNLPPKILPFSFLPQDIRDFFIRVFDYNEVTARRKINSRPTAKEWADLLYKYAEAGTTRLKTCKRNRRHVYPDHHTECPWCKLEKQTIVLSPNSVQSVKPKPVQPVKTKPVTPVKPKPALPVTTGNSTIRNANKNASTNTELDVVFLYAAWLLPGALGTYLFAAPIKTIVGSLWGLDTVRTILLIVSMAYGLRMASKEKEEVRRSPEPVYIYLKGLLNLVMPLLAFVVIHAIILWST